MSDVVSVTRCESCGRRLWKGYLLVRQLEYLQGLREVPAIKVVCWRCKLRYHLRWVAERSRSRP